MNSKRSLAATFSVVCLAAATGCAHHQLRFNTVHQSQTLTGIYEQQVLDNLAMFVHDPNSLPYFATPSTGSSQVTDQGSAGSDLTWRRIGFDAGVLKLFGQRQMLESWSLSPVSDPRRLELMRCAYQQVVANCGIEANVSACPDCDKIRNRFHFGSATASVSDNSTATGQTTPACLYPMCWIGVGCKKCVPQHGACVKVGKWCNTHVWVLPGGQDELSKLTLLILDYALYPPAIPPRPRTVEVEYRLKKDGTPVDNVSEAAQVIKATLDVSGKLPTWAPPRAMTDEAAAAAGENFLDQVRESVVSPVPVDRFQPPHLAPNIYQQQLELRAVTPPPLQP